MMVKLHCFPGMLTTGDLDNILKFNKIKFYFFQQAFLEDLDRFKRAPPTSEDRVSTR